MLNSKFNLESPEDQFSGALHVYNVDFYDGSMRIPTDHYDLQKTTHIEGSAVNNNKLMSFPHSFDTHFWSILDFFHRQ